MKSSNRIVVTLNKIHLCDELWNELDQRVKLVSHFPTAFTNYLREEVSTIIQREHVTGELCVAKYEWISKWIFIWENNLKIVSFNIWIDVKGLGRNGRFMDWYLGYEAVNDKLELTCREKPVIGDSDWDS